MEGVQSQSALVAGLILLGLCINVVFERRRLEHRVAFATLLIGFSIYNLAWCVCTETNWESGFWLRILLLSGVIIAQACLSFFERFLRLSMARERTVVTTASIVLLLSLLTDLVYENAVPALSAVLALGTYAWCIWRLHERQRASQNAVEKTRLSYLVIGGAVSIGTSAIDLMPAFDLPSPAIGHVWLTVYMYFWMQVVLRSRLLDLQEILGRGIALFALSSIVSLVYVALLVWVDKENIGLFFFNTVAASMLLFFIFEPLKRTVDRWSGRLLFPIRHDLEVALDTMHRQLSSVISLEGVIETVIASLRASRRITHASIFILDDDGRAYRIATQNAHLGSLDVKAVDGVRDRSFLDAISENGVLSRVQMDHELFDFGPDAKESPGYARLKEQMNVMAGLSAHLTFAFRSGQRLLGFLNLKDDRTEEPFSSYEISLFARVTAQITTAIENSELVRQIKERDRLSALGEMATGMAHEIRNPLGAIKSAAQLFAPKEPDPETKSLQKVIVDEANRLDAVLAQFLYFARPYRGELGPVPIKPILERVATLIRTEKHAQPISLNLEMDEPLPPAIGDDDQLLQICLNLAKNACQAMEADGGVLNIKAHVVTHASQSRTGRMEERIEIVFSDTGPGMPDTIIQNLFIPFFTTKRSGTGLGLPICQRLLQHHGSEIKVQSVVNEGTDMSFRLILWRNAETLTGEHRRLLTAGEQ